ncbi:CheY-like chemotaxis protein [Dokdonella fugitiva]|uniref:CheY-like chemotaxis protein n=1 Tax=Dokdonella fugitiva TaxID=328517 RepID=A0A839EXT5_9GAMM|nr:response regulator [Dokdonella fugitiva]MBA8889517.1 CheY-like chemotaxis protein [Dokdonella fugitiva]
MSGDVSLTRHISSDEPRVLVVDGSRVVRQLIERVLKTELPNAVVVGCGSGADAQRHLADGVIDLVTTALRLPDMDGLELARLVRESGNQAYIPVIVVSGDVQERLVARTLSSHVTDYFDKALGFDALAAFIRGYVKPAEQIEGNVLYVEDSRVVALATRRMMEKCGFKVAHVVSVEDALALLETSRAQGKGPGTDLVLTDVNLKGELSGGDLLERIRGQFGYPKGELPVLVMTGDDNPANQAGLLRAGANDLVHKPIEERLLVNKLQFQLRVARRVREQAGASA